MYDHALDGFHATLNAVPYVVGGLLALLLGAAVGAALLVVGDTIYGTARNAYRTHAAHRAWARSGRTKPR